MATEMEKQLAERLEKLKQQMLSYPWSSGTALIMLDDIIANFNGLAGITTPKAQGADVVYVRAASIDWLKAKERSPAAAITTTLYRRNEDFSLMALYTHPAPAAPAVPEGYALVPVVPNNKMRFAGSRAPSGAFMTPSDAESCYRAMLSAAPRRPTVTTTKKRVEALRKCVAVLDALESTTDDEREALAAARDALGSGDEKPQEPTHD